MEVTLSNHWGPILIAVISAAGTILVTVLKMRGDREAGVSGEYQGLLQEMKAWTSTQLEQQKGQIEELRAEVGALRDEVHSWKRRFREAVAYIRELRAASSDRSSLPPVPEHLQDEIDF